MIRVLLCCEGNLNKGGKSYVDNEYINTEGVMQVLIQAISCFSDIEFIVKGRQDILNISGLKPYGKHSTESRKLAQLAKNEGCRFIAYHQDEDNKGLDNMYQKVHSYLSAAKEKGVSCLAIVPQHMTESWLMSDENAFEQVFGKKPTTPELPRKPEETWGSKGTSNYPKTYLANVLSQFGAKISPENYTEIAKHSNEDVMRKRCPKSFNDLFCKDIQSFIPKDSPT